jgi:hypothetical protein
VRETRFYSLLHQLLSSPSHRGVPKCIARLSLLDLTTLLIIRMIPAAICGPNLVRVVESTQMADDLRGG